MDTSQYLKCPPISTAQEQQGLQAAQASFANAYEVRPFLSQAQVTLLLEVFSPIPLIFRPQVHWGHPIQRLIHDYLAAYVRRRAGRCLEVGAHPRSVNEHPEVLHRCFLRPAGRDVQRWVSAPRRGPVANMRRTALRALAPLDRTYCFDGFAQCQFQAQTGLALYSLHDLTPAQTVAAMVRHGLQSLYAVLHLPPEALLPEGRYSTPLYTANVTKDSVVVTYEGDTSAGYVHRRDILCRWLRTVAVNGCHRAVFERVRCIGCHYVVLITHVPAVEPMPYTPFPRAQCVYVRSVYGPAGRASLFVDCCRDSTFHAVPIDIWDRLMLFGNTLDDQAFCCSRLMTYLRGISHRVVVGTLVANTGWAAAEAALTATIAAAYLTICHHRFLRSQGISKGIRRLQKEQAQSFLMRLWSWLCPGGDYGRDVGLYKQAANWISAGLVFDPRTLLYSDVEWCSCCVPCRRPPAPVTCCCLWSRLRQSCFCSVASLLAPVRDGRVGSQEYDNPAYEGSLCDPCDVADAGVPSPPQIASEVAEYLRRLGDARDRHSNPLLTPELLLSPFVLPFRTSIRTPTNPFDGQLPYTVWRPEPPPPRPPTPVDAGPCPAVPPPSTGPAAMDQRTEPTNPPSADFEPPPAAPPPVAPPTTSSGSRDVVPSPPGCVAAAPARGEVLARYADGSVVYAGSIFDSRAVWLVNASNPQHVPGGGLCGAFAQRYPESFDHERFVAHRGRAAYTHSPRPIIHAVAPDYRQARDPEALEVAFAEACSRSEVAAFPLLGAGIYCVPRHESFAAWERNHLPGDELWLDADSADWFKRTRAIARRPNELLLTPAQCDAINLALDVGRRDPAYRGYLGDATVEPGSVRYRYIAGVPGSGKSTGIRRPEVDIVVCPTRELRDRWRARGFTALTPHVALARARGARLVIDEAPAVAPELLALLMQRAADVVLLGDPNQIPALDFDGHGLVDCIRLPIQPTEWRTVTHRCPHDVCYLIRPDYPNITTSSRVRRSILFSGPERGQRLVFTQAAKAAWPKSITVHEAQGATFDHTTLIATSDARGLLMSSRAHAIVALTRHTETCRIVDEAGLLRDLGVTDAMLSNFLLAGGAEFSARPASIPRQPVEAVEADLSAVPPSCVEAAYHQLSENLGHRPAEVAAILPPIPEVEQGQLKLPLNLNMRYETCMLALTDTVHCRVAAPADRRAVLGTLAGRYAKRTRLYRGPARSVRDALRQWVPTLPVLTPTSVELAELVEAMVTKGQDGSLVLDLDLAESAVTRISFFQKDCNKFTTEETHAHFKVGQGISAWSKTTVALFGPWFRAIEKAVVDHLPPTVFYADCFEPALFSAAVQGASDCLVWENDFSEFDSTQNDLSLALEVLLMEEVGMPEWLRGLYFVIRSAWKLYAPQESLRGFWKKHSGEPGTLLFNTIWNMAVISSCYTFEGLAAAAFKGDDSVVLCRAVAPTIGGADLIARCGLKLKTAFRQIGGYAGFIVAPGVGVVPDVVRFAGRLSDKNFGPDPQREADLRDAVTDFLNRCTNLAQLCIQFGALFYGVEPGLILNLFGALKTVALGQATYHTHIRPILDCTHVGRV
uniref:Nonstructural polyprotein n=1 Tax=Hepatitis E virus TaxID=1678143 RepID=A0A1X9HXD4_HEV|nr:nonstructural polyprotein [Hepatitis E virus]